MTDFPITPEALTTEWLSDALGFPVEDFEVVRFGEDTGIIAMVTRVLPTAAADHLFRLATWLNRSQSGSDAG